MTITVILHISNEDPVVGEIEDMPTPADKIIIVSNPRKKDGKDIHYIDAEVTTVIWPWDRISFLEILPSEEEEKIIGFVRD